MTIDLYDRRKWHTESVRMPEDLWQRLDRYLHDLGPHGFAATFPLRDVTRGSAIRAIVETWLGEAEAARKVDR